MPTTGTYLSLCYQPPLSVNVLGKSLVPPTNSVSLSLYIYIYIYIYIPSSSSPMHAGDRDVFVSMLPTVLIGQRTRKILGATHELRLSLSLYIYIYIYTYIYHHHRHYPVVPPARISMLSLATSPYRSSPLVGLQGYIACFHFIPLIPVLNSFEAVAENTFARVLKPHRGAYILLSTDKLFRCIITFQCGLKLGSKPAQLYVRLSIRPLGQQAYHVGLGIIRYYVATAAAFV